MMPKRVIGNLEKLAKRIGSYKAEGKGIVFASGSFDILHVDHIAYLEYAKEQQQWLNIFAKVVEATRPDAWVHEPSPALQSARNRLFGQFHVQPIPVQRGERTSSTAIREKLTIAP